MFELTRSGSGWNFTRVAQSQPTDSDNRTCRESCDHGGNLYGTAIVTLPKAASARYSR